MAARLMERLEGLYGDDPAVEIERVLLVVAVGYSGRGRGQVHFDAGCDTPNYVARGLLAAVDSQLEGGP